jgi:ABC-type transport system involved in multi-copper enzyme maturation permease subunit
MGAIAMLTRVTAAELMKLRGKSVAWVTLALLFVGPIAAELFLASAAPADAVFPHVVLFAGEVLLVVVLMTLVVSVMTLGNDHELGTVRAILSRGVGRSQFVVSKVLACIVAALAGGFAYVSASLLSSAAAHSVLTDVPLLEAAGRGLVWRGLAAVGVLGLAGFVFAAVVVMGLVVGKHSWVGMLAGLGAFTVDFAVGDLGAAGAQAHRYTVTHHALSLLTRCFEADTIGTRTSGQLWETTRADPLVALAVLMVYGCGLTLVTILVFRRQDLTRKT